MPPLLPRYAPAMNNPGSRLRGQLLGSFALHAAGQPRKPPGMKVQALVALLAARAEPVSRAELVELLWPDGQLVDLRQLLPKARTWLADPAALTVTPTEVSLNLTTDAAEFVRLVELEDYAAALALWPVAQRGERQLEFLADLVAPSPLYADWLARERDHLNALRQEALLAHGLQLERNGELTAATAAWRDLLTLDGLAEEAQRGIMRVALLSGEVQAGLEQYELFLQRLRREFDGPVEPLPETVHLAAELRLAAEQEPVTNARLHELTGVSATFTGRRSELEHLDELLRDAAGRVVTIAAPGGSGKTMLAVQLALRWREQRGARLVFLELEHLPRQQSLSAVVAAELGVRAAPEQSLLEAAAQKLREDNVLLILDGAEARPAAGPELAQLGAACSGDSRLLVTSRSSLDLYNEVAWILPGMSYPEDPAVEAPLEHDAVRLFCHAARRSLPDFDPGRASLQLIGRICAQLGGLPLAVVLAASLTRSLSLEAILQSVQDDPLTLQADLAELPERQRRLHNVVATTWVNMAAAERESLQKLSVFRGGFDTSAARRVADAGLHRLLRFVNRSLVSVRTGDRFDLHPLLRAWGLDSLGSSRLADASRLHSEHFLGVAGQLYEHVSNARLPEYLAAAKAELSNFMAALLTLEREQRWDEGVRLCMQLVPLWDLTSRREEAVRTAERFLPFAASTLAKGRLLSGLGSIHRRLGHLSEALSWSEAALAVYRELDEQVALAMEFGNQAMIARARSEFGRAQQLYDQALSVIRGSGHEHELSVLLNNYGVLLQTSGQLQQALQLHRECLALREQRGDVRGIIDSMVNIGNILTELGQGEQAVKLRLELLAMPELQDPQDVTARHIRLLLAYDYLMLNRFTEAEALLPELLSEARAAGDRMIESYALVYLAQCAAHTGRPELAVKRYRLAATAFKAQDNRLELARLVQALALLAGRSGNWPYFHRAARLGQQQLQELGANSDRAISDGLAALQAVAAPAEGAGLGDAEAELAWLLASDPLTPAGLDSVTAD